jgi:hypothetical protein
MMQYLRISDLCPPAVWPGTLRTQMGYAKKKTVGPTLLVGYVPSKRQYITSRLYLSAEKGLSTD